MELIAWIAVPVGVIVMVWVVAAICVEERRSAPPSNGTSSEHRRPGPGEQV
jgi:hypothetical protein